MVGVSQTQLLLQLLYTFILAEFEMGEKRGAPSCTWTNPLHMSCSSPSLSGLAMTWFTSDSSHFKTWAWLITAQLRLNIKPVVMIFTLAIVALQLQKDRQQYESWSSSSFLYSLCICECIYCKEARFIFKVWYHNVFMYYTAAPLYGSHLNTAVNGRYIVVFNEDTLDSESIVPY